MKNEDKTNKKITLATVKSFIRKNKENLYFRGESSFSGMSDMVERAETPSFKKAVLTDWQVNHTLGIQGAWFVGKSRDYFTYFSNPEFTGIHVYNTCGSFTIATKNL